jgi:hypothetical protein
MTGTFVYKASKTIGAFMLSEARIRALVGPLGSGKSMGGLMELFRRMVQQAPDENGIRPTRFALVRNTAAQLRETLLKDATSYFGEFFNYKVSTSTMEFRFKLADGTFVESDWLLTALDRPEDQKKLLSLNLTGALVDECREVPYDIIAPLDGRIGRFPPKVRAPRTWRGMILVSNPWSVVSEYHTNLVLNPPPGWELFKQPGGLDPDAENLENLDPDYYTRLLEGRSQEWIDVHVHGKWGSDPGGQAVYKAVWKGEVHIARGLKANPQLPVVIGMDFGRTPAAVITQEDLRGRVLVLKELSSEDMGLHAFLEYILIPYLKEHYTLYKLFVIGDPAGAHRSQLDDSSAFSVLKQWGLSAMPAPTNDPMRRIQAVERRLLQRSSAGPGLLVSLEGCPLLIEGFERGYKYRRTKTGDLLNVPDKAGASARFTHVHDALQYAVLGHQNNFIATRLRIEERRRTMTAKRISPKAWT